VPYGGSAKRKGSAAYPRGDHSKTGAKFYEIIERQLQVTHTFFMGSGKNWGGFSEKKLNPPTLLTIPIDLYIANKETKKNSF
jgi:hypothetical protein